MKKLWIGGGLVVALVVAAVAFWPASADAQATVLNKGRDDTSCTIFFGPNVYQGGATFVSTPSGNVHLICNTSLVSGPGVSQTTKFKGPPCDFTFTKSGRGNASCHF